MEAPYSKVCRFHTRKYGGSILSSIEVPLVLEFFPCPPMYASLCTWIVLCVWQLNCSLMYTCILTCIHVYFVQALCSVKYAVFYNVYLIIKFFISLTGLDRVTSYVSNGLFLFNDMQPPPSNVAKLFFCPKRCAMFWNVSFYFRLHKSLNRDYQF